MYMDWGSNSRQIPGMVLSFSLDTTDGTLALTKQLLVLAFVAVLQ